MCEIFNVHLIPVELRNLLVHENHLYGVFVKGCEDILRFRLCKFTINPMKLVWCKQMPDHIHLSGEGDFCKQGTYTIKQNEIWLWSPSASIQWNLDGEEVNRKLYPILSHLCTVQFQETRDCLFVLEGLVMGIP